MVVATLPVRVRATGTACTFGCATSECRRNGQQVARFCAPSSGQSMMSCWRQPPIASCGRTYCSYGFGLLIVPSSASLVSVKKFGRLLLNSKGSLGSDTGLHPKPDESVARHTQFNSKIRFNIVLIYVQVFQLQLCMLDWCAHSFTLRLYCRCNCCLGFHVK